MYNFFYYFIRYTIVRNLNKLFKPKNLLLIAVIVLMFVWVLNTESKAAYQGDFDYSDPNNLMVLQYESVINDFSARMQTMSNTLAYRDIISDLKNANYGYYVYYGRDYGLSSVNGMTYDQRYISIAFFDMANLGLNTTAYDSYFTIKNVDVKTFQSVKIYTIFPDDSVDTETTHTIYLPSGLFNYNSAVISALITDNEQENINNIVTAIEDQTTAINQQTNTINAQNEFLQETPNANDFSSSDLPSDTTTDITQDGFNSIFTMFYNTFTRQATNEDYIEIPFPFTNKKFYIPYNYTARYVPSGIKSIISMFWYFAVGLFIIKDILNKIQHIKSGDLENMQNSNIKGDLL